jgi:hypothetical protein
VNGNPETTQPPGLAAILALVISLFGWLRRLRGGDGCFETLGFVVAYDFHGVGFGVCSRE